MGLDDDFRGAVHAFLAVLDDAGRQAAVLPFDDDLEGARRHWVYWPDQRRGVRLADVDREAAKAASKLLAVALSPQAFAQANAVMALEEVLDRAEGWEGSFRRHSRDYWVMVFGDPDDDTWGWRFEGHHVSVHATIAGDEASLLPLFLGANPARVERDGHVVSAPLQPEEDLGFSLLHALSTEQRSSAVLQSEAPDDIVTKNRPIVGDDVRPEGVPLAALQGSARAAADALAAWYLARVPDAARPAYGLDDASFCWAGGTEPGEPHYYRVQGAELLVELDNTQNGANHIHTIWRDLRRDFGTDLLQVHRARDHG